ncbi:unnamed protein product [Symbiodinium necroappetens]|uniref:Uncharacterized protein n=1 Tax=Symbiodinium necroappetens TaxID=1628268 RepID=A0A812UAR8_9DINO|nr:unnamed protein product [Symbiodinium necroappetens]
MAHVGTVFTSSVLCFVADAAPRPGPDEVMNFKAHQVLHLFDLISLVQVCQTTPIARARAREVMTRLRLEAMERLRISLPKLPSMGRVVFHLVCPEPAFAFRAMGSMLELGKVFHLGGAVAKKAERAAAFLEGLYERSCRLMRVREAMFLDTVGVVQAEIAEPPKEEDRLILDIEDYLFDYGALDRDLPLCSELRLLVRPDEAPGHFRRFVKAAAAGLEVFSKDGTPECKKAFDFYRDLAKTHALDELRRTDSS